jgi:hypothetical protein
MRKPAYGAVLALFIVTVACGSATSKRPATDSPAPSGYVSSGSGARNATASWPTYHGGNDRAGSATGFPTLHALASGWNKRLDAAVYGQPVVAGDTALCLPKISSMQLRRHADTR